MNRFPQRLVFAIGAIAAGGDLAGCLFTDPVNSKPHVTDIETANAMPPVRGQMVTFTANVSDPDGDKLKLEWSVSPMACPDQMDPSKRPTGVVADVLMFKFSDSDSVICVWVLVTDSHGATDFRARTFEARNRPPVAKMTVQQPVTNLLGRYDLFSGFRVSAGESSDPDGDAITRKWTLLAPNATSNATLTACSPTAPEDVAQCFLADVPGDYKLTLTVRDGSEETRETLTIRVDEDAPPRITLTLPPYNASPLVLDPAASWSFAVLMVDDDGDPFPGKEAPRSSATFAWKFRHNGGDWRTIPGFESLPSVLIAADTFVIGDKVDLRVEVLDRVPAHSLAACGAADICPTARPQRITWNMEYR